MVEGPCRTHGDVITGTIIDCATATRIVRGFTPTLFLAFEHALHEQLHGLVRGAVLEVTSILNMLGFIATLGLSAVAALSYFNARHTASLFLTAQNHMGKGWGSDYYLQAAHKHGQMPPWAEDHKLD